MDSQLLSCSVFIFSLLIGPKAHKLQFPDSFAYCFLSVSANGRLWQETRRQEGSVTVLVVTVATGSAWCCFSLAPSDLSIAVVSSGDSTSFPLPAFLTHFNYSLVLRYLCLKHKPILKEVNPEYSLKGLLLKLKLQSVGHLTWRADSLEKTLMLGNMEGRRRRVTEDEVVGWHHWLDGREFKQIQGDSEGQGSLACCSPWGHKESDTT